MGANDVPVGLFDNPDFKKLSPPAQWLYVALLSHPDIDHRVPIPVEVDRWAGLSADQSPEVVADALSELVIEGWLSQLVQLTHREHTLDLDEEAGH
jgi:hypothetical protein